MTPYNFRNFAVAALLTAALAVPVSAAVPAGNSDLRASLERQGIDTTRLEITVVEDIVILKGRVVSQDAFVRLEPLVREAGYSRVANLARITVVPDDAAIERRAERELVMAPYLEGCRFTVVESNNGVLRIEGTVQYDLQRDAAAEIARNVAGVSSVIVSMQRI